MNIKGFKVNFLGDSITEGVGVDDWDNCRFDNRLAKLCQLSGHNNYGVGGSRLPEKPGIVADSAKDVHGLHKHHARRRRLHQHGVLIVGESVHDAAFRVRRHRDVGKNLLQQLWSCFRRSACTASFIHETEIRHGFS